MVGGDSLNWMFSWDRSSSYGALATPDAFDIMEDPDTHFANF